MNPTIGAILGRIVRLEEQHWCPIGIPGASCTALAGTVVLSTMVALKTIARDCRFSATN